MQLFGFWFWFLAKMKILRPEFDWWPCTGAFERCGVTGMKLKLASIKKASGSGNWETLRKTISGIGAKVEAT